MMTNDKHGGGSFDGLTSNIFKETTVIQMVNVRDIQT
jgi:hypothetical protein